MFSNFIADNISSDSYGIMCVQFGSTSGSETVSAGGETELITDKTPRSNKFHIISQEYSKPQSFTFQIVNIDGSNIDAAKERSLKKWLCKRGEYFPFQIDDDRFHDVILEVNISNPQLIKVVDSVGMEFTVNCKSSFGYSPIIKKKSDITTNGQQIKLFITNDDDDYIYPDMVIKANEDCNLTIANSTEVAHREFVINNLKANEEITILGSLPDISTSRTNHAIWSDFNKRWLRLIDGTNILTVSNKCTITLSYSEPRKVGV